MKLTDTTLVNNNRGWTEYNDDTVCHVEDITEYEMVFLHNYTCNIGISVILLRFTDIEKCQCSDVQEGRRHTCE